MNRHLSLPPIKELADIFCDSKCSPQNGRVKAQTNVASTLFRCVCRGESKRGGGQFDFKYPAQYTNMRVYIQDIAQPDMLSYIRYFSNNLSGEP